MNDGSGFVVLVALLIGITYFGLWPLAIWLAVIAAALFILYLAAVAVWEGGKNILCVMAAIYGINICNNDEE